MIINAKWLAFIIPSKIRFQSWLLPNNNINMILFNTYYVQATISTLRALIPIYSQQLWHYYFLFIHEKTKEQRERITSTEKYLSRNMNLLTWLQGLLNPFMKSLGSVSTYHQKSHFCLGTSRGPFLDTSTLDNRGQHNFKFPGMVFPLVVFGMGSR
jgi:hypothetical protein